LRKSAPYRNSLTYLLTYLLKKFYIRGFFLLTL